MKLKSSQLRDAVVIALVAGATTATAHAQEATNLDRIEVTGSRIRQVDTETAQPVLSISRASIEKSGFKTVADVLQNIAAAGSPAISRSEPLSSGEAVGGFYIDLRNLGAERTLVLVDGKRLGASVSGLQDVSQIPSAIVERIDVLKDGASSIYGSDAIAGVINIITRKNFQGLEANAYVGQYGEGDGQKTSYDFVAGFTGDRGSITIGAEYAEEKEVWAKDRWFSRYPRTTFHPAQNWSPVSQWGTIIDPDTDDWLVLNRGGDYRDVNQYHDQDFAGITGDTSNSNTQMHLLTPTKRRSVFANVQYDLTDNIRFVSDLLYTRRESQAQVAGYPLQSASYERLGAKWDADSYYNPFGKDMGFMRRGWEVPRLSTNKLTTFRFTGALQGSFQFNDKYFDWEAGYIYQNSENQQSQTGNYNVLAVNAATGPSFYNPATGRVECGTAAGLVDGSNPIYGPGAGGCLPWNPAIPYGRTGDGGLTGNPDLQQFLFPTTKNTGEVTTKTYYANIAGSLFTLPAGDLGFALGYEYREDKGSYNPDALSQTGYSTDLAAGPTGGGYDVNEVYLELNVPILADLPGAKELSFNAATRYSKYSTFGNTTNNKFGLKWKPIDQLLVRATYAEGFRAPTIDNLYGGSSQTFAYFTDPCDTDFGSTGQPGVAARCAAAIGPTASTFRQLRQGYVPASGPDEQTPDPFNAVSNPNLTPEKSKSKTVGLVWSPTFAQGLNMSLDWWNIKITNTIVTDSPDDQLNDCYVLGIAERCNSFTRDPNRHNVINLTYAPRNAGYQETEGFDFDVAYRFETDSWGTFNANLQNSYVTKNVLKTTNAQQVPVSILNGFGSNFRLRSNLVLGWERGDWGVTWGTRYFSSVKERCYYSDECSLPDFGSPDPVRDQPMNKRGSTMFHDVQVSWNAPWNATIAVGARNVFDHYGPQMYSAPNSQFSYYGGYDIGRFMYMQYKQKF
ncbi:MULTISPECIES: TonB-dependent receptor plug domain-containing protein [Stenotrophomonas]|mgnify:FL=1|jgi:iron complex outermembrane receptor protein|uniref:TonB-dependent receptor n=3 Tax=Bacteria TaxID=2 RepID=A0AA41CKD2_STEMA|nr:MULTISPECIES: TonB-dependent receptor [Stenotrophomonas]AWB79496.1 TonB-dependent receptor [Stenotrophomonas maltophilia]KDE91277.1 TonB-dependent receptor [Stenotrophomonas maltophilia M30]CCH13732.1 TonB-dependent receptor [Stenotrophomonas maltophilia D457]KKF86861.1 TonB-dependent receptor [Stenotrophomonas maltophilia]KOO76817.1 TonB-dependent receptor [Stenotrophomonas maltophilia]